MKITSYLDFDNKTIESQINNALSLNINYLILRYYDDNNKLIDISEKEVKDINLLLRKNKVSVYAIDPLIKPFNLNDEITFNEVIKEYEKAFKIANLLKTNQIIFRLPIIDNVINEFEVIKNKIDPIIDMAVKNNKVLYIKHENITTSIIGYVLKKYNSKNLKVIFSPADAILNNDSPLAGYRVLKSDFNVFIANDIDSKENPELLGYGRVNIIDLFKRMRRDRYNGDIILDERFIDFYNNEQIKKVPIYKKLFNKKSLFDQYLEGFSARIFPNEKGRKPNIIELYENQINVIKVVFNQ